MKDYIIKQLANHFAPYLVTDSYGTQILCWSRNSAINWLYYCAPYAQVMNRWNYKIVAVRVV